MRTAVILLTISIFSFLRVVPDSSAETRTEASPRPSFNDFPLVEMEGWGALRQGWIAKEASRLLSESPNEPLTVKSLIEAGREAVALDLLRKIVETRPDLTFQTMEMALTALHFAMMDQSKSYAESLCAIADDVEQRAKQWPREDAAHMALFGLHIVRWCHPPVYDQDLQARQEALVQAYSGTEAARLTEIELIYERYSYQQGRQKKNPVQELLALEKFVHEFPGTTVAAKALTYKIHVLFNWAQQFPKDTLTDRSSEAFLEAVNTVRELTSGRYPPCEWADQAPGFLWQVMPTDTPPTLEGRRKRLTAYQEFARTYFELSDIHPYDSGIVYVLTDRMSDLLEREGRRDTGLDQVLAQLERSCPDPVKVRFVRALCYLNQRREGARDSLAVLNTQAEASCQRKALSTLAADYLQWGDFAQAARCFREFANAHPESEYAWIATLRIGQCEELLGNLPAALPWYRDVASVFASNPVAVVLGNYHLARCLESRGMFPEALAAYRASLDGWDNDYAQYGVYPSGAPHLEKQLFRWTARISKQELQERIAELEASLRMPGGDLLERGRLLLKAEQWKDARAALDKVEARYPASPAVTEARYLAHLAGVEDGLALADASRGKQDIHGARRELNAIAKDAYDPGVGLAKIALASLALCQGKEANATAIMSEALRTWHAAQKRTPTDSLTVLEQNLVDIRNLFFRREPPKLLAGCNAVSRGSDSQYFIVDPEMLVQLANGENLEVKVPYPIADADSVLFVDERQLTCLSHILTAIGGRQTRPPVAVMEPPNQPVGDSRKILAFWNAFFPCRPGHWAGWELETPPRISKVEFMNEALTRAGVSISNGYSGATIIMDKEDGVWVPKKIVNQWIT